MITPLALLAPIACSPPPPALCLPVVHHEGSGQVALASEAGTMVVTLETGAGNLKVFEHGAPWWRRHWPMRRSSTRWQRSLKP